MALSALSLRFDSILHLQQRLDRFPPGSHDYEVADKACSLALNSGRTTEESSYFVRNLIRDAERTLRRRAKSTRHIHLMTCGQETKEYLSFDLPSAPFDDPHKSLCAVELEKKLRGLILNIRGAIRCLEGLLLNETPTETALALGVPVYRVQYLRTLIRKKLSQLLQEQRALD